MARLLQLKIEGFRDYLQNMKLVQLMLPKRVLEADIQVANEIVLPRVKARMSSFTATNLAGGTTRFGSANVATLHVQASKPVRLVYGGLPHSMGHEFGALTERQFARWTGSASDAGYVVMPTVRDTREHALRLYMELLGNAFRRAYPH